MLTSPGPDTSRSQDTVRLRLADWRRVAAAGHELGNHTLYHRCSGAAPDRDWVQAAWDLDTTPVEQQVAEVRLASTMLAAIDGRTDRTFTVPCGDRLASGVDYVAQVAGDFVAIKAGDGPMPADLRDLDPAAVPVIVPVGASGAELIAEVERAGRAGTMVNFTFHGVGGDYLSVPAEAHEALLAYLDAHRDRYWVDSFQVLMRHVRREQERLRADP